MDTSYLINSKKFSKELDVPSISISFKEDSIKLKCIYVYEK